MTKEQLAGLLNGRNIDEEITPDEAFKAAEASLVVIFGASDDLMEMRGAIDDEFDCFGGHDFEFSADGILKNECENEDCPHFKALRENTPLVTISAIWCGGGPGNPSWQYRTKIPHATFDVMEEGELFCRGIVFSMDDLKVTAERNRK